MQIISINKIQKMQAYLTGFQIKILIMLYYLNEKKMCSRHRGLILLLRNHSRKANISNLHSFVEKNSDI